MMDSVRQVFVFLFWTHCLYCARASYSSFPLSDIGRGADFDRVHLDYAGLHPHEDRSLQQLADLSSIYQPIRIKFDTQAIESRRGEGFDDKIDFILSTVLPVVAGNWSQHLYVVPNTSPIKIRESECYGFYQGLYQGDVQNTSLSDAYLAILVSAYDFNVDESGNFYDLCQDGSTLASAFSCALDQVDRPSIGAINFCLKATYSSSELSIDIREQTGGWLNTTFRDDHLAFDLFDIALHEIGHVLGFASNLYVFYRDEYGNPRTPRPFQATTVTCPSGETLYGYFPSEETVKVLPTTGGRRSFHIVTERVAQVARNQLNCQSLEGARLDDRPGSLYNCMSGHWHERLFQNELSSPSYASASANILSPLTLALMEDTGFYRVNYRGVRSPSYGLGAGCDFVYDECIVDGEVPDYGNNSFCATPIAFSPLGLLEVDSLNSAMCDQSHQSWVTCDLYNETFFQTICTKR